MAPRRVTHGFLLVLDCRPTIGDEVQNLPCYHDEGGDDSADAADSQPAGVARCVACFENVGSRKARDLNGHDAGEMD
jgi:hypothetical protein